MEQDLVAGRTCGECVVCCVIPHVQAPTFTKEAGVMCQHCSGSNCTIYEDRPSQCRDFYCLWRRVGTMPDELRPDRTGVMFTIEGVAQPQNPFEKVFVIARALSSLADFDKPIIRQALDVFVTRGDLPVWLSFNQERRLLHPRAEVRDAILSGQAPNGPLAEEVRLWRQRLGLPG